MLKEIHEQADAVAETVADRLAGDEVELGDIGISDDELRNLRRVVIVACGTSYHAGLIGRYAIEEWARVPVEMDIASEFRYRNPVIDEHDLVIGISQSGETADTLAAMRLAREQGAKVLAVTNIMGSQATRDSDGVLFTRAGLEIGVAATKTFVAQVAAMYLFALKLAQVHGTLEPEVSSAPRGRAAATPAPHRGAARRTWTSRSTDRRALDGRRASSSTSAATSACPLPRGRAQAQGDLLHPHRRLRGRRDEARPDRAARRAHARWSAWPPTRRCSTRCSRTSPRCARAAPTCSRWPPRATTEVAEHAEEVVYVPRTDWLLQPMLAVIPLQLLAYYIAARAA